MVPENIRSYLRLQNLPVEILHHPQAVSAQKLAQALHVSGHEVVKSVVVRSEDGRRFIAVLAATDAVDPARLGALLGLPGIELCTEDELQGLFSDCELGAEPPFGRLYGLPVVMDASLLGREVLLMRAGSHSEALRMARKDYVRLEQPTVGDFAGQPPRPMREDEQAIHV